MTDIVPVTATAIQIPPQTPEAVITRAAHVATLLKDIIERQNLFTKFGEKKYPHVDAWICLGSLMDAVPREKHIEETKTGDFIATVEIINKYTKEVLMEASGMCGSDEPAWARKPRFSRRSMAVTRATGKAFRLLYSWAMCMAGYAPTPEEEMPNAPQRPGRLEGELLKRGVDPQHWEAIAEKAKGKTKSELDKIIHEVTGAQ